ncbi:PIN domain-containing protein [Streptomyces violaceoruber]|uniref:PIN domain-containing protein n=1 Tax=Streptomyces violaceoruber group TaxID=2867121 RepID=UPI00340F39FD
MIILDTCILWKFTPESSSGDLLRAIRATGTQRVGVPWMVMEELAAQQAVKYRAKYEAAAQAVESLSTGTPWNLVTSIGPCDEAAVRAHWREAWSAVVQEIETSNDALREAAFREANCLPPCKESKGIKTGSRDAAIWLSAVEYARKHPDETVYFASDNTKDFGDGSDYPPLLKKDLEGVGERFVHLTNLDQVVSHFTEPVATDMETVTEILGTPEVLKLIPPAAQVGGYLDPGGSFQCRTTLTVSQSRVVSALSWFTVGAQLAEVESAQMYRVGDQEWCTAVVRWHLAGYVTVPSPIDEPAHPSLSAAGCEWTATVLFRPDASDTRLTVLRAGLPEPLTVEDFGELPIRMFDRSEAEEHLLRVVLPSAPGTWLDLHPYQQHPTHTGAARRRRAAVRRIERHSDD